MANKVEAIKAGKFGVEVEMYNITRENAAKVVANFFGTAYTVAYEGSCYKKWICKDAQGRKWVFMSDSSIHDAHGGCEMVTPVLNYEDMELLQEVIRVLRRAGAKSDPAHECGIHVHVDAEGQTAANIKTLTNLMSSHDALILNAIGVDEQRRSWCRPVDDRFVAELNRKNAKDLEAVKKVWYESQGYSVSDQYAHYSGSRYNILNLHSLWQGKGIEFRCFQFDNATAERKGGLHAGQLKAYIQLCLALCTAAKTTKYARATANDEQRTNPRRVMYRWMEVKLGMQGEEFQTARKLFIRNLEGVVSANRIAA